MPILCVCIISVVTKKIFYFCRLIHSTTIRRMEVPVLYLKLSNTISIACKLLPVQKSGIHSNMSKKKSDI